MILRGAQIANCEYELEAHRVMARAAGVSSEELDELADWRSSSSFSPSVRAALEFVEAMCEGFVPDSVNADLAKHFDASERVELILTAGMYTMVPRVVNALRLSHEEASM
jgi:AhpD family alkylhydroperoxidase